ncbi:hypothetical protein E4U19_004441 [Claviceps sp. Clav32 group G5]|nr:hypothetical protein E4U19_004441 [Claviceps sp. Clav32 group G5]
MTARGEFQLTVEVSIRCENICTGGLGNWVELMDKDWIRALMIRRDRAFTDGACRTTTIPEDNYTQAVAAYKGVAAQDRAFELRSALRARAIRRSPSRKPSAGNPRHHSITLGIQSRRNADEWHGHPS